MRLTHTRALDLATKVAANSPHTNFKMGCVITNKKKQLVSVGINQYKTHPLQYKYGSKHKWAIHAELAALAQSLGDAYHLYVVRLKKSGGLGMAKPCKACATAILEFGVEKVYWSTSDGTFDSN